MTIRQDKKVKFSKFGIGFLSRYLLTAGDIEVGFSRREHREILHRQLENPVKLASSSTTRRTWWLFRDEFYWEDDGYDEVEVKALVLERLTQKDRRVQRAVALMQQTEAIDGPARAPLPDEVKVFVWNRDGGRCVKCGSNQRLEFDHVIPVAMGGANTARNLQLLCETCNRSKGAALA